MQVTVEKVRVDFKALLHNREGSSVTTPLTIEQKIEAASLEAAQVAALFAPQIGLAIQAGAAVEPLVFGLVGIFKMIFAHHTQSAPAPVISFPPTNAGETLAAAIARAQAGATQ